MYSRLYSKINYAVKIPYLYRTNIIEYDISKANISVLYSKGIIDKNTYDFLCSSERMVRQTYVGKLQKNSPKVTEALQSGIIQAKQMLFEANDIQDNQIFMIKNDAVFLLNRELNYTRFGLINFVKKNVYSLYYHIESSGYDLFYHYDKNTKNDIIDIKNISKYAYTTNINGFYKFIHSIMKLIDSDNIKAAIMYLKKFYLNYITLNLDKEFYRNFNNESMYHFIAHSKIRTGFMLDSISQDMLPMVDRSYNLGIIVEIQKMLMDILFKSK